MVKKNPRPWFTLKKQLIKQECYSMSHTIISTLLHKSFIILYTKENLIMWTKDQPFKNVNVNVTMKMILISTTANSWAIKSHIQPSSHTYSHQVTHTAIKLHIQPSSHTYSHQVTHTAIKSHIQPSSHTYSHQVTHIAIKSHIQPSSHTYSHQVTHTAIKSHL
jgi:hypothetical protein